MLKAKLLRKTGPAGGRVLCGFTVEGHAGFAEYGKDIVCAGVSAIAQAALFGLQEILGDAVKSDINPGFLRVSVDESRASEEGPRAILRTLELGFRAIERSYPGAVELCESQ
ncbi:MAG: ribosomal-processing cysteine protease Prp [Bacillota bacterium]